MSFASSLETLKVAFFNNILFSCCYKLPQAFKSGITIKTFFKIEL